MSADGVYLADDPLWYKDVIIYELHVRAFFDNNADGVGDFEGLIEKLDYLENLGVTAIWLLPFTHLLLKMMDTILQIISAFTLIMVYCVTSRSLSEKLTKRAYGLLPNLF